MKNIGKYRSMPIEEFAEFMIHYHDGHDDYHNDTDKIYDGTKEGYEEALKDEIEWLNQECKE